MASTKSWESISQSRREHLANTIAAVNPHVPDVPEKLPLNVTGIPRELLSKEVISITEQLPEQLVEKLAEGSLTSTVVTQAFLQRAGLASRLTNCITELLPEAALERAKFLDEYLATHKKPIGPLHGLPISVKEHVSMKGLDLNCGFVSWVGRLGADDAPILRLLRDAGAVFYARTTEPQTLMHLETSNNIYGVTVNPFNAGLTSGGSSGGEGALLGLRGSCLGIGTDIGGSIRSPAAANGVFGLRPTSYRLPTGGLMATMMGAEHIVPVVGPLSTSLAGVRLFLRALLDAAPWRLEAALVPLPYRAASRFGPADAAPRSPAAARPVLRVGLLPDDGIVTPHPPIARGFAHVVAALRKAAAAAAAAEGNADGPAIELVDFPPYRHDEAWRIISSLYFADGGAEERAAIEASGEPWRPLSDFIIRENPNVRARSVPEVWELTVQRDLYRNQYLQHWNSVGRTGGGDGDGKGMVDVLLCPVGPGCAPLLNCARYWNYTSQWNLLDYPALVFPTGLKCGPEDKADVDYKPRNEQDAYNHQLYSPEKYVDAPISLQLVGRRYEDEKLIEALELILKVTGLQVDILS